MRFDPFGIFAKRDLRDRRRGAARYARTGGRVPSAAEFERLTARALHQRKCTCPPRPDDGRAVFIAYGCPSHDLQSYNGLRP